MMSIVEMNCPNCDAPIPMQARGRFTCVYCTATLEVYSSVEAPEVLDNGEVALFEVPDLNKVAEVESTVGITGEVAAGGRMGTLLDYQDFSGITLENGDSLQVEYSIEIQKRADKLASDMVLTDFTRSFASSIWDNTYVKLMLGFIIFWICSWVAGWMVGVIF